MIPEKLYGRDHEVEPCSPHSIASSRAGGRSWSRFWILRIGKSAVVNELHKPLVPPRGLFASGKFDQYKRDIPYATLAQAFQSLIRPLLNKDEEDLRTWREALSTRWVPNGRLFVDLVRN